MIDLMGMLNIMMGYNSEAYRVSQKSQINISSQSISLGKAVNAVAAGRCRHKIKKKFNWRRKKAFPVLIHE